MEYYVDIRESKWARCYTSALLTRRLIFIVVILLFTFLNRDCIFGILLAVQFFYLLQLLIIRPFKELENNIVETVNEVFYITFISLMLYLDGDAMWTETMTILFVSLITANSLVITIILLSNLNVNLIAFFVIALIKWWKEKNENEFSRSLKLIQVINEFLLFHRWRSQKKTFQLNIHQIMMTTLLTRNYTSRRNRVLWKVLQKIKIRNKYVIVRSSIKL
jgi:hypothetical protein